MTLEVEITARNLELTDRINDYVIKKVSKLDRYLNGIDEARVDLAQVKSARNASDRQVAQIAKRQVHPGQQVRDHRHRGRRARRGLPSGNRP